MYKRVSQLFDKLAGDPKLFSFEERLFNSVSIIAFIPLVEIVLQNAVFGLKHLILPWMVTIIYLAFCYFLSRYFRVFSTAKILFGIGTYLVVGVNFFQNNGIDGPSMIGSFIPLILLFAISNRRGQWTWGMLYILFFGVLLFIEYNSVVAVKSYYTSVHQRFIDVGFTYMFSVFFVLIITLFIRRSLAREQLVTKLQTQQLARQHDKLNQANNQLRRLLSIISHDLRNPLNTILAYLDLLSDDQLNNEEKALIGKQLKQSTQETRQLVENLLIWSRSQENGFVFTPSHKTIGELFSSTPALIEASIQAKNIQIKSDFDNNKQVYADKILIDIMLRNLLQNAIMFSPFGSTIHLSGNVKDQTLIIRVKDEGPGLPNEVIEQLAAKEDDSTSWVSSNNDGGLGLHLCKMSVRTHGGEMHVVNNLSHGTEFIIKLPA